MLEMTIQTITDVDEQDTAMMLHTEHFLEIISLEHVVDLILIGCHDTVWYIASHTLW